MKLKVDRKWKKDTYTISNLYIDGVKICNVIEDKDRGLKSTDNSTHILVTKIKGKTAIPTGTYTITLDVVSPRYSKKSQWVKYNGAKMPRLLNVPGFDGILMHPGNTAEDTDGCLLPGKNDKVGQVSNSTYWFKLIYEKMKEAKKKGETIVIEIG